MSRSVFTKWLWDGRRGLLGWMVAIAVVGGAYASFWPLMNESWLQQAMTSFPPALMEALGYTDISTAAGYLNATVYGLLTAILMLVYSVTAGARIIAGDEQAGTLELILAHPVSRTRVAVQRFAALVVSIALLVTVYWLAMLIVAGPANLGIGSGALAAMHVHVAAFGVLFAAISFSVGAATGRRDLALALGAGAGVLAYALRGLLPQVEALTWVKDYSAFTWLNGSKPLANGVDPGHLGLMLGIAVVLAAIGTWVFTRRDVT